MGEPTSKEVYNSEYIGIVSEFGELKHLSNQKRRNQNEIP